MSEEKKDIDNWPGMPLVGPSNLEEMNARIDQAEQEINEGIGFSWEQVMSDAQSIVSRYALTRGQSPCETDPFTDNDIIFYSIQ